MPNSKKLFKPYTNGAVFHINFGRTFHPELKDKHLGVLFNINSSKNMILCLPLTSPKEKHFKTLDGFNNRDFHDLKYSHLYYIKETDSIILFEQFRTISKGRIESQYKEQNKNSKVILSTLEQQKIKKAFNKFIGNILV